VWKVVSEWFMFSVQTAFKPENFQKKRPEIKKITIFFSDLLENLSV